MLHPELGGLLGSLSVRFVEQPHQLGDVLDAQLPHGLRTQRVDGLRADTRLEKSPSGQGYSVHPGQVLGVR